VQLYSLNIFRAFAIVLVVLGHAAYLGSVVIDTLPEAVVWNIIVGATTLFVFISGFLFHHVFLKKFDFAAFLTKKLGNLLIPYLVLSLVALAVGCQVGTPVYDGVLGQVSLGAFMLGAGQAASSYWYVPFIITLFAMSPFHVKFAGLSMRWQAIIIVAMLAVALVIHRPVQNIGPLQNLLYYTPVYLLGLFCSQHRDIVYPMLTRWTWPLLAAVLALAVFQAAIGKAGNYSKPMQEFQGIDLMLVQKLCMCLFMLSFLRRFEAWRSRTVDVLADTSFATFFLHPLFIHIYVDNPFGPPLLGAESWLQYLVVSALCIATCAALALCARRLFGARSRMLTGY
jgi:surface polysaccharide O-acyltransferase-like enzyme